MKRLFFLLALAIVAAGAMAQGPQGSRGHHNDRHGHGNLPDYIYPNLRK